MKWLQHVSYLHRVLLTLLSFAFGGIVGSVIGAGICLALAIWFLFVSAPAPSVSSFGDPFEDLDPYRHVSSAELKRRHAELNRSFHFLTDEQRQEHDRILHTLLMRGERP